MDIWDQIADMPHEYMWLLFAALLGIGEIFIPGVFLIWIAAAAAITGILTFIIGFNPAIQFGLFALLCIASVYFGRKWYLERGADIADPMLNDRSARMIGQTVIVTEDISPHAGRAKVGDSEWPARGNGLKKGKAGIITSVENGIIHVEAL